MRLQFTRYMRNTGMTRAFLVRLPIWLNFTITPLSHTFEWVDACVDPGQRGETGVRTSWKIISCYMFLRNTCTDPSRSNWTRGPPRKAIGPLGSNCFSREVLNCGPCNYEVFRTSPLTEFSGSAHGTEHF